MFVSISQVIGCEDRLRNDLYCVEWGVKLYSIHPVASYNTRPGNEVGLFYTAPEPTRGSAALSLLTSQLLAYFIDPFIYCKKHITNVYLHDYERAVENKHLHVNKNKNAKANFKTQNTLAMPKTRTESLCIFEK